MQLELEPKDRLQKIQEKATWARKEADILRDRLAEAEHAMQFWQILLDHLSKGHYANVLLTLRQEGNYVRYLRRSQDPIVPTLEDIQKEAEHRARELLAAFVRIFPDATRQSSLSIDASSRHPTYTFNQGFIRVDIDEREFTAKITPRDGQPTILGIDVAPLTAKLRAEIARIFEREFQPEPLLRSLHTAYLATLRAEHRLEGEEVPLRRVTNRLAKNLNRFAYDEFNVDLSRLIQSGSLVIDGRRAHFNHTRNTRQGMLLHGLEQGGYVGFISFKKEG